MNISKSAFIPLISLLFLATLSLAEVSLPSIISDNMVIQQNTVIPIWGWAQPGEQVLIEPSWSSSGRKTTADHQGNWMIRLKSPGAGGPLAIKITASNVMTIQNIVAGEVWFCSGQSNMQMPLKGWDHSPVYNAQNEIKNANCPDIRTYNVQCDFSETHNNDSKGEWITCDTQSTQWFSAVSYFFGKKIHQTLKVPVGLIHSSWGDTPIEAWIENGKIKKIAGLESTLNEYDRKENQRPGVLYNAMVHPFVNYRINGFIWYQGENNRSRAKQYKTLFPLLIMNWRDKWQQPELPFYYAQLTSYYKHAPTENVIFEKTKPTDSCWAQLRESQLSTLKIPFTGMAVTIDVGSLNNIHPPDKQTVGERLALWALAKNYGKDVPFSGPLYKSFTKEDNKIRLNFDYSDGLYFKGGKAEGFSIAGKNNQFVWATAEIDKNSVIVYNETVPEPTAVRYGWANYSACNLYNAHDLPASPFRTDHLDLSDDCD